MMWAMQNIFEHPERYPGLTSKSAIEDFQSFLHESDERCPKPCPRGVATQPGAGVTTEEFGEASSTTCHTAKPGEECYVHMMWAMQNIFEHPERYPGLTSKSAIEDFQSFLHESDDRCPKPCSLKYLAVDP